MPNDVIRGAIKIDNFLQDKCFTSWKDFVLALPQMLTVEVPTSVTNVTVGTVQPGDDEKDNLWIRRDNSGSFLGMYIFAAGSWKQIFPVPNEIFYVYGDSRQPPPGYSFVEDVTTFSVDELNKMRLIWHVGGTVPTTWYSTYHCVYVGF